MNSHLIRATYIHGAEVAAQIRAQDAKEVAASHGMGPLAAVRYSMRNTNRPWALVDDDGVAVAVGGISGEYGGVGFPWFLATDRIQDCKVRLVRACREVLAREAGEFERLVNFVFAENEPAIRLIVSLGFRVEHPVAYGLGGELFRQFHMEPGRRLVCAEAAGATAGQQN